jgi:hypothetical protein
MIGRNLNDSVAMSDSHFTQSPSATRFQVILILLMVVLLLEPAA